MLARLHQGQMAEPCPGARSLASFIGFNTKTPLWIHSGWTFPAISLPRIISPPSWTRVLQPTSTAFIESSPYRDQKSKYRFSSAFFSRSQCSRGQNEGWRADTARFARVQFRPNPIRCCTARLFRHCLSNKSKPRHHLLESAICDSGGRPFLDPSVSGLSYIRSENVDTYQRSALRSPWPNPQSRGLQLRIRCLSR